MTKYDVTFLAYCVFAMIAFVFETYHFLLVITAINVMYFLAEITELVSKWNLNK